MAQDTSSSTLLTCFTVLRITCAVSIRKPLQPPNQLNWWGLSKPANQGGGWGGTKPANQGEGGTKPAELVGVIQTSQSGGRETKLPAPISEMGQ